MARIYVGSINFDVDDEKIRTAFGPFGPIKNVNMSIDPATGVSIFLLLERKIHTIFPIYRTIKDFAL